MATDPRWDQLTLSAKAALRWAWATAIARTGASEPLVLVDSVDLLAGLALAHLKDSPVSQLLEYFRIPPGVLLSEGGSRTYNAEAILAAERRIPDSAIPGVDSDTGGIFDYAFTTMPTPDDQLITLSMLAGALLETTNAASMALRTELANRGVDVEPVLRSCREHLGSRVPYADYLRTNHPYQPPERQLPPYAPDEPRSRRPPSPPGVDSPPLVDITAEVNAFAYLIASKDLTPPLAIGLFGDWGSGKSYFLRSVQRQVDHLVTADVEKPPFYKKIAQIEFNAWQYVEGNLWASLLEHLFRNLRRAGEDDDDLLEVRRREYLSLITERTAEHRHASEERDKLVVEQRQAHEAVQQKISERDKKLAELAEARRRRPFLSWEPSEDLKRALSDAGIDVTPMATQADELRQTLVSTAETVRRAGPVLGAVREGGWPYAAVLIVVIGLGPLISFMLSWVDVSAVSNAITSVSMVLGGVTAFAARGNKVLTDALNRISQVQAKLDAELDEKRQEYDQQIRDAEIALENTERALHSAFREEQRLAASVDELEAELARITPGSVLSEFLGTRIASDDYRRHLGVPALVRQDLERLSRLIEQHHHGDPVIDDEHAIDRIVLYIDDLDRCPTKLVIKVLQAVHLLLAFPVFVVVVAVDARWLTSSLREHYSQLRANAAVPSDYLEKVFQVPFWVQPLSEDTRSQMVGGLLKPHLADPVPVAGDGQDRAIATELSDADLPEFTRLVKSFSVTEQAEQPWLEAAKLTVTTAELESIQEVSPLIGATPRAVKRFINIYLLLKSVGRSRSWPMPEQGQVPVLLAIATGLPRVADELLPRLAAAQLPTLRTALSGATFDKASTAQQGSLDLWLQKHPNWYDISLNGMDRWVGLILRFRFDRTP